MESKTLLARVGIKLTSRKLWGLLLVVGLVVFIGYVGGWILAVDFGKVVIPIVAPLFMVSIAYEKRGKNGT